MKKHQQNAAGCLFGVASNPCDLSRRGWRSSGTLHRLAVRLLESISDAIKNSLCLLSSILDGACLACREINSRQAFFNVVFSITTFVLMCAESMADRDRTKICKCFGRSWSVL